MIFISLKSVSTKEWLRIVVIASLIFGSLGTLTALWDNPFFIRMTPISWLDFVLLGLTATLLGLFLGVKRANCSTKKAGAGGVLGFLGFGCSICNQILVFLLGTSFLLVYFEPVRYYVGVAGVFFLTFAVWQKLSAAKLDSSK